jgi:hypothetical protein
MTARQGMCPRTTRRNDSREKRGAVPIITEKQQASLDHEEFF